MLYRRTFSVAYALRRALCRLLKQILCFSISRIWVNDGYMSRCATVGMNLRRIIGTVHEIIAIDHPLLRQDCQWKGDLTIMNRCRCDQATIGPPPSAISMCHLCPVQDFLQPFALRLDPTVQSFGKSLTISSRIIVRWRVRRFGAFRCSLPFFGRSRLRATGMGFFFFGTAFSRASIAVESREICPNRCSR